MLVGHDAANERLLESLERRGLNVRGLTQESQLQVASVSSSADGLLLELGERISDGIWPMAAGELESVVRTLADTPPEALDYMKGLMRKQGLRIQ